MIFVRDFCPLSNDSALKVRDFLCWPSFPAHLHHRDDSPQTIRIFESGLKIYESCF